MRDGLDNRWMGMSKHHRPPGADEVYILAAIDVYQSGPLSLQYVSRGSTDRSECTHR